METLYDEMKDALKFFGLSFHEMARVEVSLIAPDLLKFSFGRRSLITSLSESDQ